MLKSKEKFYRAEIFSAVPSQGGFIIRHWPDGILEVSSDGVVKGVSDAQEFFRRTKIHESAILAIPGAVIHPGMVDLHVHFPQTLMIGAHGATLLDWLQQYTFPEEEKFADLRYAKSVAGIFIRNLLRNGTTTAVAYSSSHFAATGVLFQKAKDAGIRLIAGMVSMDRNCPDALAVDVDKHIEHTEQLIGEWHGRDGRLFYALTPRFLPSCSDLLMTRLGEVLGSHSADGLYVQTHISENQDEIAWVRDLYPTSAHYAGAYDRFSMLGARTILGHGIHLEDLELQLLRERGASIAHCPTSNLFLGSGDFSIRRARAAGVGVGLATDVAGGTSFSMWKTMAASYMTQKSLHETITPSELFILATASAAQCLNLPRPVGCLEPGYAADFVVSVPGRIEGLKETLELRHDVDSRLAALIFSGDDRITESVYVGGEEVWKADER